MKNTLTILLCCILFLSSSVMSGEADVANIEITSTGLGQYVIHVTVKHNDTGWDHYANAWEVLDEEGNVIAERILHHPHIDEQPFTRSLRVALPEKRKRITLRAKDSVHGDGGKTMTVDVPPLK